jgi:formylglycine-generating enzyme required for sulfatase activity
MARLIVAIAAVVLALPAWAQVNQDAQFQEAGVCARCHVISVIEWGMSGHRKVSTGCESCHGASKGHVIDERNNVKPDRMPTGGAIAGLCADCHKGPCPKSKQAGSCQDCHHFHALVNPKQPSAAKVERTTAGVDGNQAQYARSMDEGGRLAAAGHWDKARVAFEAALRAKPGDPVAAAKLKACDRRLKPGLPGFEIDGSDVDAATGLPRNVRVAGIGTRMRLVPGGSFDMGAESYENARPVHTVRVRPFYLGVFEITQGEWKAVMNSNPSANAGDRMPVEQVSWTDAQAFVRALNEKVAGVGFRLPVEAEWEFVARAGAAAVSPGSTSTTPVDSTPADKSGFHGLLGNVWEWTSSLNKPYPYDAADGRESLTDPGLRILRGGGFTDPPDLLNAGFRHAERHDRRLRWNGLRIARDVPEGR